MEADLEFPKVYVVLILRLAILLAFAFKCEDYQAWERQQWLRPSQRASENLELVKRKVKADIEKIEAELSLCTSCQPYWDVRFVPVRGRYFLDVPKDPWGRDYLFDGCGAFLGTYGRDGRPGGDGLDADIVHRYAGPLGIEFVQLRGAWGKVKKGCELIIHFGGQWHGPFAGVGMWARPVRVVDDDDLLKSIRVYRSAEEGGGWEYSLHDLNAQKEIRRRHSWKVVRSWPERKRAFVVVRSLEDAGADAVEFDRNVRFDLEGGRGALVSGGAVRFGLVEDYSAGGPLDQGVFGPGVKKYWRFPRSIGAYKGVGGCVELRGCRLDRG